jgi:hypothetical protein
MHESFPIINEPCKQTEFELQALLYFKLKQLGLNVRGEVRAKHKGVGSQFDLVVFANGHAAAIIEVKDSPHKEVLEGKLTRQSVKYAEYGIPVIYFTTIVPIENVIKEVLELVGR